MYPVLNKKTKEELVKFKRRKKQDRFFNLDFYFNQDESCCGVVSGSGYIMKGVEYVELLTAISLVGKNRLMIYHAPQTKEYEKIIGLLKSFGFEEFAKDWKNGYHPNRKNTLVSLVCFKDV